MFAFCTLFLQALEKYHLVVKNKKNMDNQMFVDGETIPIVHQDKDYDDYNIPNASRIDETSFMEPATEATSTLQKVKRDT